MRKVTLALATTVAAALAAAGHASAATPQTFTDPVGDNGTAPDVTQVVVDNDQLGQYEFDVSFATDYGPNAVFSLYVDADKNAATGDTSQAGADYAIFDHAAHTFEVDAWNGTDWAPSSDQSVKFTIAADSRSLQISVNRSDLGNTTSFNFFVVAGDGAGTADSGYLDDAPSGQGTFAYDYQVDKLTLSFVATKSVVKGRTWTVAATVRRSDTNALQGSDGTIACRSKLPVLMHSWVSPGGAAGSAAVCVFQLPRKSGKQKKPVSYTATMTVGADGSTTSKTVSMKR